MRIVVVGAGPAGLAFSAAVARDHDVIVLETGPRIAPGADPIRPIVDDPAHGTVARRFVRRRAAGPVGEYLFGVGVGGGALVNGGLVVGEPDPLAASLLPIEPPSGLGPVARALLASHTGARPARLVARGGRRVDLARELLGAAPVEVRAGVRVDRVVLDGRRAVGVVAAGDEIAADLVVVCAGAIGTPGLLLRSFAHAGLEPGRIGEGLQDTTCVPITLRLDPAAAVEAMRAPPATATAASADHRLVAIDDVGDGEHGVLLVCLTSTRSRGSLRLDPSSGEPDVDLGQLTDAGDRRRLTVAVLDALATLGRSPWPDVVDEIAIDDHGTPPDRLTTDPDSIVEWAGSRLGGTYHAAASCAAACDESGAVRGCRGLVVADASTLASVPERNPFLAAVAHATRLGRRWREP